MIWVNHVMRKWAHLKLRPLMLKWHEFEEEQKKHALSILQKKEQIERAWLEHMQQKALHAKGETMNRQVQIMMQEQQADHEKQMKVSYRTHCISLFVT
jgi:hypothetical protein